MKNFKRSGPLVAMTIAVGRVPKMAEAVSDGIAVVFHKPQFEVTVTTYEVSNVFQYSVNLRKLEIGNWRVYVPLESENL